MDVFTILQPSPSTSKNGRLDDYIRLGKYTALIGVITFFSVIVQAGNMTYMVYAGLEPRYVSCLTKNDTFLTKETICKAYHAKECDPNFDIAFYSINLEFAELCDGVRDVKFSISIQMIGVILGSFIIGQISDKYGRKWTMFWSLGATFIFGLATALSHNIILFTVIRFLTCFATGGHVTVIFVLMCEMFPKRDRFWLTLLLNWSPSMAIIAALACWAHDWRTLTIVLNLIPLVPMTLLLFIFETPHFLLRIGNIPKARRAIQGILLFNNQNYNGEKLIRMLDEEKAVSDKQKETSAKYNFFHIFYSWKFVGYSVVLPTSLMIASIVNYTILFDVGSISGNIFLNMALMGAMRYIINIITAVSEVRIPRFGRRFIHIVCSIYTLIALTIVAILKGSGASFPHSERILLLTGIGVISQLFVIDGVIINELFPTPIRNTAFAFLQTMSRTGVTIAPLLGLTAALNPSMPFLLICVLISVNLYAFFSLIPETKGKPLPDHMPTPGERIFAPQTVHDGNGIPMKRMEFDSEP